MAIGSKAVFLDKDGTLVPDVPYNVNPALIRLAAGAGEALRGLRDAGYKLVVVSNQSGVALGLFPAAALYNVRRRLDELLAPFGVHLNGFYFCPHAPEAGCDCRKPRAGMLKRAAGELGIDLGASWMVGDILDDVEAGRRAGCRAVLLNNGHETRWLRGRKRAPDIVADDLLQAAAAIDRTGSNRRKDYER